MLILRGQQDLFLPLADDQITPVYRNLVEAEFHGLSIEQRCVTPVKRKYQQILTIFQGIN